MHEELIPIIAILMTSLVVMVVVLIVTRSRQRRVEAQFAMQSRLVERFSTANEFVEFLQSPAGREFVAGVHSAPGRLSRERIAAGFGRAIILIALSAAFLFITFWVDDSFGVAAVILFALGVGYMLATFVSYKLAAKFTRDSSTGL